MNASRLFNHYCLSSHSLKIKKEKEGGKGKKITKGRNKKFSPASPGATFLQRAKTTPQKAKPFCHLLCILYGFRVLRHVRSLTVRSSSLVITLSSPFAALQSVLLLFSFLFLLYLVLVVIRLGIAARIHLLFISDIRKECVFKRILSTVRVLSVLRKTKHKAAVPLNIYISP